MLPSTREAPPRRPGQRGRARIKGERLPNLSEVAQDPRTVWKPTEIASWYGSEDRTEEILRWFMMRWQLEVSFQEMRRHLGFETQRQWSDMAIRRTTPALLGLFS